MGNRTYIKRKPGDIVCGAVLLERVNGQRWRMQCQCGRIFVSQPSYTSGRCKNCGYDFLSKLRTVHGESPSTKKSASRLYRIWNGMRARCNGENNPSRDYYGGRGIRICKEWDSYETFKKWALENGYKKDLSIDRIDVNGDYSPENCRWATQKEQCRNKRTNLLLTHNGQTRTLQEWSEITGIRRKTISNRIKRYGYTVDEALTARPRQKIKLGRKTTNDG